MLYSLFKNVILKTKKKIIKIKQKKSTTKVPTLMQIMQVKFVLIFDLKKKIHRIRTRNLGFTRVL